MLKPTGSTKAWAREEQLYGAKAQPTKPGEAKIAPMVSFTFESAEDARAFGALLDRSLIEYPSTSTKMGWTLGEAIEASDLYPVLVGVLLGGQP